MTTDRWHRLCTTHVQTENIQKSFDAVSECEMQWFMVVGRWQDAAMNNEMQKKKKIKIAGKLRLSFFNDRCNNNEVCVCVLENIIKNIH